MPSGSLWLSAGNNEFLSFSLHPHTAHQPTDGCATPTLSHHFPTVGLSCDLPGDLSDPNNKPDNGLPNLFNNDDSLPPSLPCPHSVPLSDSLPSHDPLPPIPDNNLVLALTQLIHTLAVTTLFPHHCILLIFHSFCMITWRGNPSFHHTAYLFLTGSHMFSL